MSERGSPSDMNTVRGKTESECNKITTYQKCSTTVPQGGTYKCNWSQVPKSCSVKTTGNPAMQTLCSAFNEQQCSVDSNCAWNAANPDSATASATASAAMDAESMQPTVSKDGICGGTNPICKNAINRTMCDDWGPLPPFGCKWTPN